MTQDELCDTYLPAIAARMRTALNERFPQIEDAHWEFIRGLDPTADGSFLPWVAANAAAGGLLPAQGPFVRAALSGLVTKCGGDIGLALRLLPGSSDQLLRQINATNPSPALVDMLSAAEVTRTVDQFPEMGVKEANLRNPRGETIAARLIELPTLGLSLTWLKGAGLLDQSGARVRTGPQAERDAIYAAMTLEPRARGLAMELEADALRAIPPAERSRALCVRALDNDLASMPFVPRAFAAPEYVSENILPKSPYRLGELKAEDMLASLQWAAVRAAPQTLGLIPPVARADGLNFAAVDAEPYAIRHVPQDAQTMEMADRVLRDAPQWLTAVNPALLSEARLLDATNSGVLDYHKLPDHLLTPDLALAKVRRMPWAIAELPPAVQTESVVAEAVSQDYRLLHDLPTEKWTELVVSAARSHAVDEIGTEEGPAHSHNEAMLLAYLVPEAVARLRIARLDEPSRQEIFEIAVSRNREAYWSIPEADATDRLGAIYRGESVVPPVRHPNGPSPELEAIVGNGGDRAMTVVDRPHFQMRH